MKKAATTRRVFLLQGACVGTLGLLGLSDAVAAAGAGVQAATAVTQVFGDGIRWVAVALEYAAPVRAEALSSMDYHVQGRLVTDVFPSTSVDPAGRAAEGRYVIVALSPDDPNAALAHRAGGAGPGRRTERKTRVSGSVTVGVGAGGPMMEGPAGGPMRAGPGGGMGSAMGRMEGSMGGGPMDGGMPPDDDGPSDGPGGHAGPGGRGGPGKAGDIPVYDTFYPDPAGIVVLPDGTQVGTTQVVNLVVDEFRQLGYVDPKTGKSLRYNLFVPRRLAPGQSYPLVLFMHDAGATSDVTRTTLVQGLGAVVWAQREEQAQRPCFVLAPQYAEIITDDDSHTSSAMDTTIHLIESLASQYPIDRQRLYTTGQSGGCMMSIAMDIQYPGFFAASFLVAGQWDPALVAPLAKQKLWILVSQDDEKAFPGENAITAALEKQGAKISRAVWDGRWTPAQCREAFDKIDAEGSPINYVSFAKGTVIPPGQSTQGASGHRNTWRIAYTIEPIREWLFRQRKA